MLSDLSVTGLAAADIEKIQQVFARYPEIDRVCLYGSRAKGNFWPGSDIDLTIMGDRLDSQRLPRIERQLDELLLPYKIDLSLFRDITNKDLIDHIQRVGIDFYTVDK